MLDGVEVHNMKVGNLITYNVGGMRNKVFGLVLETKIKHKFVLKQAKEQVVLIQWLSVGKWMPKKEWCLEDSSLHHSPITPGEFISHPWGDWFEVMQ